MPSVFTNSAAKRISKTVRQVEGMLGARLNPVPVSSEQWKAMFQVFPLTPTSVGVRAGLAIRWVNNTEWDVAMSVTGVGATWDPDEYEELTSIIVSGFVKLALDDGDTPTTLTASFLPGGSLPSTTDATEIAVAYIECSGGVITNIIPIKTGVWMEVIGGGMAYDDLSIDLNDSDSELQIWEWDDAASHTGTLDRAYDYMVFQDYDDSASLKYTTLDSMAQAIADSLSSLSPVPWPTTWEELSDTDGVIDVLTVGYIPMVTDIAGFYYLHLVDPATALDNLLYWPRGSDYTECYGESIGNNVAAAVIDLDNQQLVNGPWDVADDSEADGAAGGALAVTGGIDAGENVYALGGFQIDSNNVWNLSNLGIDVAGGASIDCTEFYGLASTYFEFYGGDTMDLNTAGPVSHNQLFMDRTTGVLLAADYGLALQIQDGYERRNAVWTKVSDLTDSDYVLKGVA